MINKILVCLDGTKAAEDLLPYAIDRATHFNSKIVLLKVINSTFSPYIFPLPGVAGQTPTSIPVITHTQLENIIHSEEVKDKMYLDSVATRLREIGLDVNAVAWRRTEGDGIADAITAYAAKNQIDLVMMAAQRHNFWKRLIYGSITESVIRKAAAPVLVISHQTEESNAHPFGEMPQASLT